MHYSIGTSWLGATLVAGTERGICAILFDNDADALLPELRRRFPAAEILPADEAFATRAAEAMAALANPARAARLPLDIIGTAFQQRIWQALRDIPAGETATYAEIAERSGRPGAARAVAGACAANPIAVAIPCHRVIRGDGSLAGYRWGTGRKRQLLQREAAACVRSAPAAHPV